MMLSRSRLTEYNTDAFCPLPGRVLFFPNVSSKLVESSSSTSVRREASVRNEPSTKEIHHG